ncbi:E3 ubiquitin-protein ligase MARCH7 isoform X1 [Anguilla rostrata]|uniref:E3 ubiquitin-protein ligase MARCH7 isoform X1 n=2 Tax=Anguilla rostrata TaxID=7938 RepID=UPI0030D5C704
MRKSKMDSKSRRLPSSLSSDSSFSSSSSLGSSRLYGRSSVLGSDRYTRMSSIKLDTEHQSSRFQSTSRDYGVPESRHSSWKLASTPVSCDRSWADSSVGSRSKLFNSQGDSERRLGTYSGLLSATQDGDSKRPKLSYTSRASQSANSSSPAVGSTSSRLSSVSDYSWKPYSPLSRSSVSSSSSSEGLRSHRDLEDRSETPLSSHRSTGLSSLYRPDRLTSSYAQGARPKDTLQSSGRLSASLSRRPPSDYHPSLLARDSCRSASRTPGSAPPRASESPAGSLGPEPRGGGSSSRPCSWYVPLSERNAPATPPPPAPRPAADAGDSDGRRTTRQLLSRLANSMSSSLFSRRSSQDSPGSAPRSVESSDASPDLRREESSSQSADSSGNSSPDGSDRRGGSDGFAFLRRRRRQQQGLAPVLETRGGEPDPDPGRAPAAWLSSSLRSRCPPLFSRRRREGRDETARMATVSRDARRGAKPPLGGGGAAETEAADGDRDEDDGREEEEEDDEGEGAGAAGPLGATASGVSGPIAGRAARRLAGVSPNSLFRISVPPSLESSLPENVMITVDIMAAGRAGDRQEKEKPTSSRDPEKLRKIQESLLLEESDEDEADLCRICQMREESPANPLLEPCRCTGSLQYVHQDCMKKWLRSKIRSGSNLDAVTTCELCKEKLHLNIDNFDINELYRTHERSEYEFISCGLYLVVLLHLCEQRFSDVLGAATDAGFFNLARTLHQMDDLESSYGESEEDAAQDSRPSIDFSDLEDGDDEEEY